MRVFRRSALDTAVCFKLDELFSGRAQVWRWTSAHKAQFIRIMLAVAKHKVQQQQQVAGPPTAQDAVYAQPPHSAAASSSGASSAALEPDKVLLTNGPDAPESWDDCVAHVASGAHQVVPAGCCIQPLW